jgi:hypothetical protein
VEAAELGAEDEEEAVRPRGVLAAREEGRVEAEGERDLGGLEEVGLCEVSIYTQRSTAPGSEP